MTIFHTLKITNTSELHFKIFWEMWWAYSNDDVIQKGGGEGLTNDYG